MFYKLYENSVKGQNKFLVKTVTWKDVPGRDENWKAETIATEMNGDVEKFEQEYECKFLGASASPFGDNVFKLIEKNLRSPKKQKEGGRLQIWELPKNNRVYSIGVDVAEGVEQDYSVIQVFDMTDLSAIDQVACYRSNDIGVSQFAKKVVEVAKMYGNPVLSVERNGPGVEVCSRLYEDYGYPNFVNYGGSEGKRQLPGVRSHTNVRTPAVTNWKNWLIDKCVVKIHDSVYLEELQHFEYKDGKWQAQKGYHDDSIMASVWALNVLSRGLVQKTFEVAMEDAHGDPKVIHNRFQYSLDATSDNQEYEFADSRVPVVLFTSASSTNVIDAGNYRFEAPTRHPGDIFDPDAWERLPDWI